MKVREVEKNMQNPLRELRERLDLSRPAFARKLGVSYNMLAAAEAGYPRRLPVGIRRGLAALGEDVERIAVDYERWRAGQKERAA